MLARSRNEQGWVCDVGSRGVHSPCIPQSLPPQSSHSPALVALLGLGLTNLPNAASSCTRMGVLRARKQ